MLAIGDAAKEMGHEVAFFCTAVTLADRLSRNGYIVYRMPESTMLGLPKPISSLIVSRS